MFALPPKSVVVRSILLALASISHPYYIFKSLKALCYPRNTDPVFAVWYCSLPSSRSVRLFYFSNYQKRARLKLSINIMSPVLSCGSGRLVLITHRGDLHLRRVSCCRLGILTVGVTLCRGGTPPYVCFVGFLGGSGRTLKPIRRKVTCLVFRFP